MSRKNFKVATAENGKTPTQDTKHKFSNVTKAPTGKVKTVKDREAIKKAREEEYKNRRINSLKRRAKRMGLTEEQINVKVKELLTQIDTPNSYDVLIFYNPNNRKMIEQALKNEGLTCKIITDTYLFIEADQETLATLRTIIPPGSKIHPYVKRKPPILPVEQPKSRDVKTKTKAQKKAAAKAAKDARKALNRNKGHNPKSEAKIRVEQFLKKWHDEKRNLHGKKTKRKAFAGTQGSYGPGPKWVKVKPKRQNFTKTHVTKYKRIIIPKATENASKSVKMASTAMKQAA